MCGICGIAYRDATRSVDAARLERMRDSLVHRGPDGNGLRIDGPVGLGHRRLSIIDVAGGAQPLSNETGSIWITYNGEVYNYLGLTAELIAKGHRFRTHSDTEALVHGYEEEGLGFLPRLNGMFAFALHDRRNGTIVLARDHFGIKPLYYTVTPEGLFFASEIKAILSALGRTPSVRRESLQEYLLFRYVAGENTFFEGIHRLPPGHAAVWEAGELRLTPFWSLPPADSETSSLTSAASQLDELLDRSVEGQLMSEVPLGTFCSGGLDSGLVTAYAMRHTSHRLKTFSVGFENPAWDESALAAETAGRFSTDHRNLTLQPGDFEALLSHLVWHHDEPLSHPNSVPIYLLSQFAKLEVTVVLTGEGADEVFGGYPRYHIARLSALLDRAPVKARSLLRKSAGALGGHRGKRLQALLPYEGAEAALFNSVILQPDLVARLTDGPVHGALKSRRALLEQAFVPGDPVATLTRYDLRTYLVCLLDRMDRMTMAASLEGRVPFLDVPLVEWGLRLSSRDKLRGLKTKAVVRRLAKRHLGPEVLKAPKSGFGVPLADWFRLPSFRSLLARLGDPSHPATAYLDHRSVASLLAEHTAGRDHGEVLWQLANTYLWFEIFGSGSGEAPTPDAVPVLRASQGYS
ncbi:MAG TPA: asparagine synthase (glutamine-hydrolyzing) [Gemmatimonadales bacterium]|jgi:asparagine synthase (glutamine-hydrolysing)|nr:asparagine synthase (glutamine-hydrolyzing) [Gemmatimonadales bacterium]HEV8600334.1 asparagine synthase (glutamine-hydrolyzing) [Gemmatimonadales bacterium]